MKRFFFFLILTVMFFVGIHAFDPPPLPGDSKLPPLPSTDNPVVEETTNSEENIFWYDKHFLPDNYNVYSDGKSMIVNQPYPGLKKRILKNDNSFKGIPGCYIACYSRDKANSVYPVGGDIYVMGQIRVPGNYINRICQPQGYVNKDISAEQYFKTMCFKSHKNCKTESSCWAGGDTAWEL